MKKLLGVFVPLGLLLVSAYVLAATLASGEGEPIILIGDQHLPRVLVFVIGFLGVAGGVAVSLASFMDLSKPPQLPRD